jgi:hypothetical protein
MQQSELQLELNKFRDYVISQAKANLTRDKKNTSKSLYNSIKGKAKVSPNSFELSFSMEDYGIFQDKGVKGKDPSKVSPNAKIRGQQAPNSPYRFGTGSASGQWDQFTKSIEKWAKKRNVRFRDEKGKYKKGNYKSLSYVIANNIYARGLRPSLFFTTPFNKAFEKLPQQLVEAYGLDAIKLFNNTVKI